MFLLGHSLVNKMHIFLYNKPTTFNKLGSSSTLSWDVFRKPGLFVAHRCRLGRNWLTQQKWWFFKGDSPLVVLKWGWYIAAFSFFSIFDASTRFHWIYSSPFEKMWTRNTTCVSVQAIGDLDKTEKLRAKSNKRLGTWSQSKLCGFFVVYFDGFVHCCLVFEAWKDEQKWWWLMMLKHCSADALMFLWCEHFNGFGSINWKEPAECQHDCNTLIQGFSAFSSKFQNTTGFV